MLMRLIAGPGVGDGTVTVYLLSGDRLHFRRYEMPRALLHGHVLIYNLAIVLFVTVMDARADMQSLQLGQRVIMGVACAVSSMTTIFLLSLASEIFFGGRKGGVSSYASVFVGIGTATGIGAAVACYAVFKPELKMTAASLFTLWAFYYVVAEVFTHLVMYRAVPKAIRTIRAKDGIRNGPVVEAGPVVEIGGQVFPASALLRIGAEGNYVRVVTDAGAHLAAGPFGRLADGLPATLGMRVGRSDWVASGAVVAMREAGRELMLVLRDGAEVRVAQARRKAVEDWARSAVQGRATSTQSG